MDLLQKNWHKVPLPIRKPVIFVLGLIVIAAGIVMIPFPGPGWATVFFGVALLATEFKFARRLKVWAIEKLKHHFKSIKEAIEKKTNP